MNTTGRMTTLSDSPALHTDLYQLTMAVGYLRRGLAETPAVCEAFVRRLPRRRSFLLAAGLERIVEFIENLHFTQEQIAFLRRHPVLGPVLDESTCEALLGFRFSGDLWAVPEGTLVFAGCPLLRVEAPLWQAQLLETNLLSLLNHATMVASKAARVVAAAGGATLLEFGTRRTQDEAAVDGARAAYLAGFDGTSNVEAGFRHGIPVFGTAAHMWTMAHPSEEASFDGYLEVFGQGTTLLVDTYDILRGTRRACAAARRAGGPHKLAGVRIDAQLYDEQGRPSGICKQVRAVLDEEGFEGTRIVASGDLNEERILSLRGAKEPIDSYGVGTELICSTDAPSLGGVYKLVHVGPRPGGRPVCKLSQGKATWPGVHQVYRLLDSDGRLASDTLALDDEPASGEPLLRPIFKAGVRVPGALASLEQARAHVRTQVRLLPPEALLADEAALIPQPSAALQQLFRTLQNGPVD